MRSFNTISGQEISMGKENSNQVESLFEQIGGLTKVKNLANEFYTVMEGDSNARELRNVHPEKLINSRKNLYRFLSEWLGGPKLFGAQQAFDKDLREALNTRFSTMIQMMRTQRERMSMSHTYQGSNHS